MHLTFHCIVDCTFTKCQSTLSRFIFFMSELKLKYDHFQMIYSVTYKMLFFVQARFSFCYIYLKPFSKDYIQV